MKKTVEKWRYFGIGKEEILKYRKTVSRDNLKVLDLECLVMAVFLYVVGTVFTAFTPSQLKGVLIIVGAVYFTALYLLVHRDVKKIEKVSPKKCYLYSLLFSIALYLICLYIGTIGSDGYPAVTLIAVIVFLQINFDALPLGNLIRVILAVAVFLTISYFIKPANVFLLDVIDAILCGTLGLFASWQKSKIKWENVISRGKLRTINYELYHACVTDELTKLPNRRQVFEKMEALGAACVEKGMLFACVVIDIDQFKLFNDSYGHPQGDALLESVGALLLRLEVALGINAGRIGGEEFMFFWAETDEDRPLEIAETIRLSVQKAPHPEREKGGLITASMGLSIEKPDAGFKVDDAYRHADDAMYYAKRSGKDSCWKYWPGTDSYTRILPAEAPASV